MLSQNQKAASSSSLHAGRKEKDHIETVIFTPTTTFESSSSSCYYPKKPECIKERVVSFENMDELQQKLFDMYDASRRHEQDDYCEVPTKNMPSESKYYPIHLSSWLPFNHLLEKKRQKDSIANDDRNDHSEHPTSSPSEMEQTYQTTVLEEEKISKEGCLQPMDGQHRQEIQPIPLPAEKDSKPKKKKKKPLGVTTAPPKEKNRLKRFYTQRQQGRKLGYC